MSSKQPEIADAFYLDEDTKEKLCVTHNEKIQGIVCPQCKALRVANK